MSVLLHVSDPHFGTEQPPVVQALRELVRRQQPELVVLSGDVTQRARAAQFAAARDFFAGLRTPLLAIPGNHDIPLFDVFTRAFAPRRRFDAAFGAGREPLFRSDGLAVAGVDTTRRWRHKHGQVSRAQAARAAAALETARPAQLRVVVVHQPVAVQHPHDEVDLLRGRLPALALWAEAGVDVVLGGHIHLPYVQPLVGFSRPMWAVQAGTALSHRVRPGAPNSVNLLRWGPDSGAAPAHCLVERWDHDAGAGAFVRAQVTSLRPAR